MAGGQDLRNVGTPAGETDTRLHSHTMAELEEPAILWPLADDQQITVGQLAEPSRGSLQEPPHPLLEIQAADIRDKPPSRGNAKHLRVDRQQFGILLHVDGVRDDRQFLWRHADPFLGKSGYGLAYTDITIDESRGQAIGPEVPSPPLRNA